MRCSQATAARLLHASAAGCSPLNGPLAALQSLLRASPAARPPAAASAARAAIAGALLLVAAGPAAAQTTITYTAPTCPSSPYTIGSTAYTVPCALELTYTLSTTAQSYTSPNIMGVNSGHNNDTSWITYMKHLGVTGLRIFGLAGSIPTSASSALGSVTGLQTWVTIGGTWGADINGNTVNSYASFQTAVTALRTSYNWLPSATNSQSNAGSVRWNTFQGMQNLVNGNGGPAGNSMAAMVSDMYGIGVTPILVFWLACSTFQFSTLDVTNTSYYWQERYELYKHTYMGGVWAYLKGVYKFEFWCARARRRRRFSLVVAVSEATLGFVPLLLIWA